MTFFRCASDSSAARYVHRLHSRTCPTAITQATNWHFFRHFVHDANPAYTPQEMGRYIDAAQLTSPVADRPLMGAHRPRRG